VSDNNPIDPTDIEMSKLVDELASLRARVEELERGRSLTCAFCGAIYPPGTPTSQHELLTAHVKKCEKHPLNQRIAELLAACSAKDEALAEIRPEVRMFAVQMETQLRANDHKPGWSGDRLVDLLQRIYDEAHELNEAINCDGGRPERIIKEAADVANFAMMIADNAQRALLRARGGL
jgi:NTP pyrophosphatase (non-canonical NTP hydrolase)